MSAAVSGFVIELIRTTASAGKGAPPGPLLPTASIHSPEGELIPITAPGKAPDATNPSISFLSTVIMQPT
ncbi:hypothetical protein GCM10009554_79650 [Kribbella koreensis]|uniref:Uncharacterized protein n=1 Tax=Kribbella koreensis TaxID=57909 RepID=A0ABN1RRG0_9ACTN